MKRLRVIPTLIVALAVLAMLKLGLWQLDRRHEKDALLARYTANAAMPPVALPALLPLRDADVFRRASAMCLPTEPATWERRGGRMPDGKPGWRMIAMCRTGAEGPGFAVELGLSPSDTPPAWSGGVVRGPVLPLPDGTSLIGRILGRAPPQVAMIVADTPPPGLAPAASPDPAAVPNNHLAYAVQWFIFAALALIIYGAALWRMRRAPGEDAAP